MAEVTPFINLPNLPATTSLSLYIGVFKAFFIPL
jgi:hypothetical protein